MSKLEFSVYKPGGIPIDRRSDRPIIEKGPKDRGSDRPIIEKGPIDRLLKRVL